jgi:2Fe-2S iron-sulfur cluster binding domain
MSTVTVTFAGGSLHAREGQSVAAALTAAGVRSWRTTGRGERPRPVLRDRRTLRLPAHHRRPSRAARMPGARPGRNDLGGDPR